MTKDGNSRARNARQYACYGMLAGVIAGLVSGGGIPGVTLAAVTLGGAGAIGGAVAGEKLNVLIGRIKARFSRPVEDLRERTSEPVLVIDSQMGKEAVSSAPGYHPVSTMDAAVLSEIHATSHDLERAAEGLDASVKGIPSEWISQEAGGKRPNHAGSAARH